MTLELPALSTLIQAEHIQNAITTATNAFYDPALKKSEDDALEAFNRNILLSMGSQVTPELFALIRTAIENGYNVFVAMHGARPTNEDGEGTPEQLDWEDKLDDAMADVLGGSVRKVIGIDWTEEATVDTQAYDFMQREQLAMQASARYVKAICEDLTINKALAQFGWTAKDNQKDTEAFQKVWAAIKGDDAKATALSFQAARRAVEEILIEYVADKGEDLDLDSLQGVLAQATDRDPLLAASAITELGGEPDDHHPAFRIYATDAGPQWMADVISQAIEGKLSPMDNELIPADAVGGTGPAPQVDTSTTEPTHSGEMPDLPAHLDRRNKDQADADVTPPDTDAKPDSAASDAQVSPITPEAVLAALQTLRDHTSMADGDIAKQLGASRASVSSWGRGKSKFEPTEEQTEAIKWMLAGSKTAIDAAVMSLQ